MNRPNLKNCDEEVVNYIAGLESELQKYRENPNSLMYDVWSRKLDEIVKAVDEYKIAVKKIEVGAEGEMTEQGKEDPFGDIKKCLSVMNEAKPTIETINWLRLQIGVKTDEVAKAVNPVEDRARKTK